MRHTLRIISFTLTAFLVVALLAAFLTPQDPRANEVGAVAKEINNEKVRRQYDAWTLRHEAEGGDRAVEIGLGAHLGLSVVPTSARGEVTLDLIDGQVSVEVYGLDDPSVAEVWLIDNRAGAEASSVPDPGDEMLYVGSLRHDASGSTASLEASLDPAVLARLEIDSVVVTLAGSDPVDGPVLFGAPSLFQRLYTQARTGRIARASEDAVPANSLTAAAFALDPPPGSPGGSPFIDPDVILDKLVKKGADIFINETFKGNGRSCATCHPATNNQTIDPAFIQRLPDSDPLFVAEQDPVSLPPGLFENPVLMREAGLILENLDGFDQPGLMRGVPHVLGLSTSVALPNIPFDNTFNPAFGIFPPAEGTGWTTDGAPGDGSLRSFLTGAIMQHYPTKLPRETGVTFRLATDEELDAVEAFLRSLGRSTDLDLASTTFKSPLAQEGNRLFNRLDNFPDGTGAGRCFICHSNAGANIDQNFFGALIPGLVSGNAQFGTGVNDLPSLPADLLIAQNPDPNFPMTPSNNPRDAGFARVSHDPAAGLCVHFDAFGNVVPGGRPGPDGAFGFGTVTPEGGFLPPGFCEEDFNVPPLVEAADTGPFFHNNAVNTIESAVAFYNSDAFNFTLGAQGFASTMFPFNAPNTTRFIDLEATEVQAIAALLRVINARENIRSARELSVAAIGEAAGHAEALLRVASEEIIDAIDVLSCGGLHPLAVDKLVAALDHNFNARTSTVAPDDLTAASVASLDEADGMLVE